MSAVLSGDFSRRLAIQAPIPLWRIVISSWSWPMGALWMLCVEAIQAARDNGGLRFALDVDALVDGQLVTVGDLEHLRDDRLHAHSRTNGHRRREAYPVEAVVQLGRHAI